MPFLADIYSDKISSDQFPSQHEVNYLCDVSVTKLRTHLLFMAAGKLAGDFGRYLYRSTTELLRGALFDLGRRAN